MSEKPTYLPKNEKNEIVKEPIYKSHSNAPHAIADAFNAMNKFIDWDNTIWEMPNTPKWQALENEMERLKREIPKISELLKSKAQKWGVDEINKFLKEQGFSIELEPITSNDLAAASVLNMPVKWKYEWEKSTMSLRDKEWEVLKGYEDVDSVRMDIEDIYKVPGHNNPIIKIPTSNWEYVCMTRYDDAPSQWSIGINIIAERLNSQLTEKNKKTVWQGKEYSSTVNFPMIDYEKHWDMIDVLWAQTTDKNGNILEIGQAKYQHILKMNENWATAKAAAAIATFRSIILIKNADIDGPFIIWFEKDWVIPFSAYISQEYMKKTINLD